MTRRQACAILAAQALAWAALTIYALGVPAGAFVR